jgi:hypothetical protein
MKSRRNRITNATATKTMSALGNHAFYSTSVDSEKGKILKVNGQAFSSRASQIDMHQVANPPAAKVSVQWPGPRFRGDKGCGWGLQAE